MAQDIELELGGRTFKAALANLATISAHAEFIKRAARNKVDAKPDDDWAIEALLEMASVIHECIVRRESGVTFDELLAVLDTANIGPAFQAVMQGQLRQGG